MRGALVSAHLETITFAWPADGKTTLAKIIHVQGGRIIGKDPSPNVKTFRYVEAPVHDLRSLTRRSIPRRWTLRSPRSGSMPTYTPAGGGPISVRVIARRPDTIVGFGDTRIHTESATFELRASEVAGPRPHDQLTVGGETFVIQGEPERRDPDRLVWSVDVRAA
jgi:hypothetical protein